MSFIKSIENHIKSWVKVTFFMWVWIYPYAYLKIKFTGVAPSETLSVWGNAGLEFFIILLCNVIIPYYIVKGIVILVKKYPTQSKLIGTAMVTAIIMKSMEKK